MKIDNSCLRIAHAIRDLQVEWPSNGDSHYPTVTVCASGEITLRMSSTESFQLNEMTDFEWVTILMGMVQQIKGSGK